MNIDVIYDQSQSSLPAGLVATALSENLTHPHGYSLPRTTLAADERSAADASAVASLPASNPDGGH